MPVTTQGTESEEEHAEKHSDVVSRRLLKRNRQRGDAERHHQPSTDELQHR
jgi:hypothetical protein